MFDKHFHSHDRRTIVQQPSKIEVTERRAPTEDLLLKAIGNGLSNLIVQELKKEGGYNG
jgi:hypothetical protein